MKLFAVVTLSILSLFNHASASAESDASVLYASNETSAEHDEQKALAEAQREARKDKAEHERERRKDLGEAQR
ncbi:hypothetical protein [Pseudoalteromonas sp. MMG022]|uniref:hypothetical protein n=1 Tax=Pseudoalteromonas sp. MMG022 TaxID=2909978 RepID=UPI001F20B0B6|nr:hypothetical protein [Pseudoalteromonas sp. MMG022]MCF6437736.1 hypothetical protein [Pseudoalteromonas sp. MMG022]